ALGLVAVAQATGDPVGLMVVSGDGVIAEIARTQRRSVVANAARVLSAIVPGAASRGGRSGVPIAAGRGGWGGGGGVVWEGEVVLAHAKRVVAKQGEAYAVHVVAREEIEPAVRAVLVNDPERPEVRRPLFGETRAAYLDAFGAWREQLQYAWRTAGARYALVA